MDQGCFCIASFSSNSAPGDTTITNGAYLAGGGCHISGGTLGAAHHILQKRPNTEVSQGQETLIFYHRRYKGTMELERRQL